MLVGSVLGQIEPMPAIVEPRSDVDLEPHPPPHTWHHPHKPVIRGDLTTEDRHGSTTSPLPSAVKNRVIRTAESGKYICFDS